MGYHVGAIMLLELGRDFHFKFKKVEESWEEIKEQKWMIFDGQQRLTYTFQSMWNKKICEY